MEPRDFCYWLNGFIELNNGALPTQEQWDSVVEHLAHVFNKVTPEVKTSEDKLKETLQDLMDKSKLKPLDVPQPIVWPSFPYKPGRSEEWPNHPWYPGQAPIITC